MRPNRSRGASISVSTLVVHFALQCEGSGVPVAGTRPLIGGQNISIRGALTAVLVMLWSTVIGRDLYLSGRRSPAATFSPHLPSLCDDGFTAPNRSITWNSSASDHSAHRFLVSRVGNGGVP
jgi:hypothetical protein